MSASTSPRARKLARRKPRELPLAIDRDELHRRIDAAFGRVRDVDDEPPIYVCDGFDPFNDDHLNRFDPAYEKGK